MMALAILIGGGSLLLLGVFLIIGRITIVRFHAPEHQVLLWDALLSMLFFIQHSGMIRSSFRARLARIIPRYYHPSTYAIASGMALTAVVLLWQPSPTVFYQVEGLLRLLARTISVAAIIGFSRGVRALGNFDTLSRHGVSCIMRVKRVIIFSQHRQKEDAMTKVLWIALVLFFAGVPLAQSGSKDDWRSGSGYRWNPESIGNAQPDGSNTDTGSRWLTTIQADGRVRGMESSSHLGRYDSRTSGSKYDGKTGSSYRWQTDPAGNTRINGFNADTGSSWHTSIKPDGSMRGTDAKGQPWTYDNATGTYMNYGSGEVRQDDRKW